MPERSQRDFRRPQTMTDQHGRQWHTSIELKTGHPCGLIQPKFTAPLDTPQEYLTVDLEQPHKLIIAYDPWIASLRASWRERAERLRSVGIAVHGDKYNPDKPSREQLDIVGSPPRPVEPVIAAKQGNKYVLGLTDKMPDWAKPFFIKEEVLEVVYKDVPEGTFPDVEDEKGATFTLGEDEGETADQVARVLDRLADLEEQNKRLQKQLDRKDAPKAKPKKPTGKRRVPVPDDDQE